MTLLYQFVLVAALQAPVKMDTAKTRVPSAPGKPAPVRTDTDKAARGPVREKPVFVPPAPREKEPQLFEYSDGYATRATIHKYSSYAMLPLFALQYHSGNLILRERDGGQWAPDWAKKVHGPLAYGVAGLFTVNTVTGVWNFMEARKDPEDRTRRTWHAALMLAADAGFVTAAFLAPGPQPPEPVPTDDIPHPHRDVAYISMGAAVLSWAIMLPIFRKD
jgi:hypothetical protein